MNQTQLETIAHDSGRGAPGLFEFLNLHLRPDSDFSIREEYPSLFVEGGYSYVARVNGILAGHIGVVAKKVIGPDFRMRVGLIGSVVTAPEYRNHGVATCLMRRVLSELKSRRCFVAILWSSGSFFERFDFVRAGREIDFRFDPRSLPSDVAAPVPFDEKAHPYPLWRLYQKHPLRVDRSVEEQGRLTRIPRTRIFVTLRGNDVTSYVAVHKGMDFSDYIHEWGGEPLELQRNIAGTQKYFFSDRSLTLIAPVTYDHTPIRAVAAREAKGVVGLFHVLNKPLLLRLYSSYLTKLGVAHHMEASRFVFENDKYSTSTSRECLNLVFGDEAEPNVPKLPFFLWGFDSI